MGPDEGLWGSSVLGYGSVLSGFGSQFCRFLDVESLLVFLADFASFLGLCLTDV